MTAPLSPPALTAAEIARLNELLSTHHPRRMKFHPTTGVLAEYPPTRGMVDWQPTDQDWMLLAAVWPKIPALLAAAERCARLTRFIDAWSTWGLSAYVCNDSTTRENLRLLRVAVGLEDVLASESWEMSRLYDAMTEARAALNPGGDS